jgi:2'-hydroxyisoflavone reductase
MRLLIIGGSIFLGRHLVTQALEAGHRVTVLNRGSQCPDEQRAQIDEGKLEHLIADREKSLSILEGRQFDAVIDTCGYNPEVVSRSLEALRTSGKYVFVSSISAYGKFEKLGLTEDDPISYSTEEENYGTLKADCEKVTAQFDKHVIIRPGLIVGPFDPTDRFTYWPARVAKGGKILAPGSALREIQFIDVRDLSQFILHCISTASGTFNVTGPQDKLSMGSFLATCAKALNSNCQFIWTEEEKLIAAGIQQWSGANSLPLWIDSRDEDSRGFMHISCQRAFQAGLKLRPLAETIADTMKWHSSSREKILKTGISAEMEDQVIVQV